MSIGYCGICKKFIEDNEFVIYEYCSYNLNEKTFKNEEKNFDGFITIRKNSLVEPILREKIKKSPSGRKKFIKRILSDFSVDELLNSCDIEVENCSNSWKFLSNGIDFIAYKLCRKIFSNYQLEGILPEKCGIFY